MENDRRKIGRINYPAVCYFALRICSTQTGSLHFVHLHLPCTWVEKRVRTQLYMFNSMQLLPQGTRCHYPWMLQCILHSKLSSLFLQISCVPQCPLLFFRRCFHSKKILDIAKITCQTDLSKPKELSWSRSCRQYKLYIIQMKMKF